MTRTEKLIAEAREIDRMATPGPWRRHDTDSYAEIHNGDTWGKDLSPIALVGCADDANFIARSRTLLPALCDALEQAQATLEQTWEWDMYKAALKEIERLRKELAALASESVKRDIALAKLEAEVMAAIEAQNAQRWIPVTERLPEHNGFVLVITDNGTCEPFVGWMRNDKVWFANGFCIVNNVTHWQPLPEPPKGREQ